MALFTLVSASGSPGVTATALGLALTWPRPVVLVEADPSGGSAILAGFYRGAIDHPGLVDLIAAQRNGVLAETLPKVTLDVPESKARILFGSFGHEQATGLATLWEPLLLVLRAIATDGQDVLVDAGRLGLHGWPRPLVSHSDVTGLVVRSNLPALVAARSWAQSIATDVIPGHEAQLIVSGPGRPYQPQEISRALALPVLGSVAWDPDSAAVYAEGAELRGVRRGAAERAFASGGYLRSLHGLGAALRSLADRSGALGAGQEVR